MLLVTGSQLAQIRDHKNPIIRHICYSNLVQVVGFQCVEISKKYESAEKLIDLAREWAGYAVADKSVVSFQLALNLLKAAGEMTLSSYGEWQGDFVVSPSRIHRIRLELVLAFVDAGIKVADGAQ